MAESEIARSHITALPPLPGVVKLVASLEHPDPSPLLLDELDGDPAGVKALASLADTDATASTASVIGRLGRVALSAILLQRTFRHFLVLSSRRANDLSPQVELIRHSLAVAVLSGKIARAHPRLGVCSETAFLSGALHDLGKFVLAVIYPKSFERLLAAGRAAEPAAAMETRALGIDHCVAGAWIAEAWSLPPAICDAIRLHHFAGDPVNSSPAHHSMVAVVRVANAAVQTSDPGPAGAPGGTESDAFCAALQLRRSDIENELDGLDAQVARWQKSLGFTPPITTAAVLSWAIDAAMQGRRQPSGLAGRTSAPDRLSAAMSCFESRINLRGGLAAIASLALESAGHLWPNDVQAIIAAAGGVVAAATRDATARHANSVLPATDDWSRWLESARVPAPLDGRGRQLLATAGVRTAKDESPLFVPFSRGSRTIGGILVAPRAGSAQFAVDGACANALLARIATAIADFESQAQSQRLADDLMETNRRLQRAQGEIVRSRALSMIAELAGGAGHELNNPLSVISGRAELLLRDADPDSEAYRALLQIQAKAHDCSRIVSQLMDFAIPRTPVFSNLSPAQVFESLRASWVDRTLPAAIRIEFEMDRAAEKEGRRASADAAQLAAAVAELIQNAIDAMHDRPGAIRVVVRTADRPAAGDALRPVGGKCLEIVVIDAGCGMSASVLQRAFDPFFSHRVAGRSRGLGLPRAFRVVEAHSGRIWLDSRPGEGTQACIQIPLIE